MTSKSKPKHLFPYNELSLNTNSNANKRNILYYLTESNPFDDVVEDPYWFSSILGNNNSDTKQQESDDDLSSQALRSDENRTPLFSLRFLYYNTSHFLNLKKCVCTLIGITAVVFLIFIAAPKKEVIYWSNMMDSSSHECLTRYNPSLPKSFLPIFQYILAFDITRCDTFLIHKHSSHNDALYWLADDFISRQENIDLMSENEGEDNPIFMYRIKMYVQRYILAVFSLSTTGRDWNYNKHWLSSSNECTWSYVRCDHNQGLTALDLHENNLVGFIPSEIFKLESLEVLNLASNDLTGTIPPTFASNTNLRELQLQHNNLDGIVPDHFNALTGLEHFNLGFNNFHGTIRDGIGDLYNLRLLHLESNHFTGTFPNTIGNLTFLQDFFIGDNEWTGEIPDRIQDAINLTGLALHNCQFEGTIPAFIQSFQRIEHLYLHGNAFSGTIPSWIGSFQYLKDLRLSDNFLQGTVPQSIENLRNIKLLYLGHNHLSGSISPDVCSLRDVNLNHFQIDCDQVDCVCCDCV